MVGEIRDVETAEIAVRAAMTGHLVLSTLHSNSAVNSITRLIDMGIEPFLVASSINCVVAQRLVRKVCNTCAAEHAPSEEERQLFEAHSIPIRSLRKGRGCGECSQSGYKGRLAIHEVLAIDDTLRAMILQKRSDSEYRNYAIEKSLVTMLEDGLHKAPRVLTSIAEIYRVTSGD